MLLYIGIADAYAMATEYLKPGEKSAALKKCLPLKEYVAHPRHGSGKGRYTDDTEMSIANAKVLITEDPPFTPIMFANEYVTEFALGGRRKGYSRNFQTLLEQTKSGNDLLDKLRPDSTKNGATMRSVPLGVLPSIPAVLKASKTQARITHDTPQGIFSARAVALMSHYALYEEGPLGKVGKYCLDHLDGVERAFFGKVFTERWSGRPVVDEPNCPVAITTVHAVADLVMHGTSLIQILKQAMTWGGDTDSVAAIAWGIASARYQDETLPQFMTADLEADHRDTDALYLHGIGYQLMARYA